MTARASKTAAAYYIERLAAKTNAGYFPDIRRLRGLISIIRRPILLGKGTERMFRFKILVAIVRDTADKVDAARLKPAIADRVENLLAARDEADQRFRT